MAHIDHWQDVLVGAILGLTMAFFAYRQYYPSLASDVSHLPYGPRLKKGETGDGPILPTTRPQAYEIHGFPDGNNRKPFHSQTLLIV